MEQVLRVAGYARISYDEDKESYESIINQSNIIKDYAKDVFGIDTVTIFEDDNYSGYKFNRPDFNRLKTAIENDEFDVILAKDLSRIGRHNARTLLFLEEMQEMGKRVIAINDSIDTSQENHDITVGVKTWYNELYVKDISKKIKSTITNKQKNGTWICSVPYGYIMTDYKKQTYEVDNQSAEVIKMIFDLYLNGSGYKKIINVLNEKKIPTPRMREKEIKELNGETYNAEVKNEWSIVSISHILENDFYIGTLRTGKYARKTINGDDYKVTQEKHNVFPDFHEPIIEKDVFGRVQEIRKTRGNGNYRGVKKYDNIYSGFTFCGDCNSPMFSISNGKRPDAYYCGSYHKNGKKACTSHHIYVAVLDKMLKRYVKRVKENSSDIIDILNRELHNKKKDKDEKKDLYSILMKDYDTTKDELKELKKQKLRETIKNPNGIEQIEEIYEELETELSNKLMGLQNQLEHYKQVKDNATRIKEISRDALHIFDEILIKEKLTKKDLELIIDKVIVFEDRVSIKLRGDINSIFNIETDNDNVNVIVGANSVRPPSKHWRSQNAPTENNSITQKIPKHKDKLFASNVINEGDPLEIFTDKEGEVILKKYSPIGELSEFASGYAETLSKTTGHIACITDKDSIIAISGGSKKEFLEQSLSKELERVIDNKEIYTSKENNETSLPITQNDNRERIYNSQVVYPIVSDGDSIGSVILISKDKDKKMGDTELKVVQSAAGFLSSQMGI